LVTVGARIKELRKSKGLSQEAIGNLLNVTRQTVGAWEKGESDPTAGQLYMLARLLNVPVDVFLETSEPKVRFLFRADDPGILSKSTIRTAFTRAVYYAECEKMLGIFASLPECRALNEYLPEVIENTAAKIREWLGVEEGPLCRPIETVARRGIKVLFLDFPNEVSGFSAYSEELGAVIFINAKHPLDRRYNTLFHELGHLVFHRGAYSDNATASSKVQEKIANHFAGAVLFPKEEVFLELGKFARRWIPEAILDDIKFKYSISKRTVLTRAFQVGLIGKKQYGQQLGRLNQKYGTKTEEPKLPEEPDVKENKHLVQLVFKLLALEEITMSRASEALGVSLGEVERRYIEWLRGEGISEVCH